MVEDRSAIERGRIRSARARGSVATLFEFGRLSGPGWLQSAITLGGGSLAGGLFLGVLTGYHLLWLQPVAMLLGIAMLGALSYVTLTTGERPFRTICRDVNPVLGWGWLLATLLANVVWCLPQFALGVAAVEQNLLAANGSADGGGAFGTRGLVCLCLLLVATSVVWLYDSKGRGVRVFEAVLKVMVGIVVLSFVGVVLVLSAEGGVAWNKIGAGLVPDLSMLWSPSPELASLVDGLSERVAGFWNARIIAEQRQVMITAFATAVGINMTFLLPVSMLARGWDREFRGLAVFDLATGLFLPFALATGCVVIASASRFHAQPDQAIAAAVLGGEEVSGLKAHLAARSAALGEEPVSQAEAELASTLLRRDAFALANALEPLTGARVSQVVFGIGVLGMALSTIIILMLISGFAVCEALGVEPRGAARRWGSLLPAVGILGPFVWTGDTKFWLAVPTSVFGMALLPIAYGTFLLLINSKKVLGDQRPSGFARVAVNAVLGVAFLVAGGCASWSVWSTAGWIGVAAVVLFIGLAAVVGLRRKPA